jgi:hypothetical protein
MSDAKLREERDAWRAALQSCYFAALPDDPKAAAELVAGVIAGHVLEIARLRRAEAVARHVADVCGYDECPLCRMDGPAHDEDCLVPAYLAACETGAP